MTSFFLRASCHSRCYQAPGAAIGWIPASGCPCSPLASVLSSRVLLGTILRWHGFSVLHSALHPHACWGPTCSGPCLRLSHSLFFWGLFSAAGQSACYLQNKSSLTVYPPLTPFRVWECHRRLRGKSTYNTSFSCFWKSKSESPRGCFCFSPSYTNPVKKGVALIREIVAGDCGQPSQMMDLGGDIFFLLK